MAFIGIDVSKAKLDCLWLRDNVSLKVKSRVFSNTPSGYQALLVWMEKHTGEATGKLHCVVEATGIYHEGLPMPCTKRGPGYRWSIQRKCVTTRKV